jgi:outer membrane protein OmpA-like peptidoglycan-associated protein
MEVPVPRQPAEPAPRRSAGTSLVRRQAQGVEVEVQSLRRRDGRLSLELAAVNRSGQPVFLNRGHSTVLRDDRGYEYPLDPPANNSELRLGPHGRLDLNLVFRGRPQAEAQAMFLAVNDLNRPGRAAPAMAPRLHLPLPMPEPVSGPAEEDQAAPPPQEPAGGERLAELMGARRVEEGLLVALLTGEIYQGGDQKVSPAGERRLRRLARLIRQEDVSAVKVVGHTDSRGEASYNQTLSLRRAEALAKWLMQRPGLEGVRFQVSGAGERQPAASNQTASGRRQNRRVEVLLRED